jgi:hypothetical protein
MAVTIALGMSAFVLTDDSGDEAVARGIHRLTGWCFGT